MLAYLDVDETILRRRWMPNSAPKVEYEGWSTYDAEDGRNWCYWVLRPSTRAAVEQLKSKDVQVAILTSAKEEPIRHFCQAIGIADLFAVVYGRDSKIQTPTGPWILVDDLDGEFCEGPKDKLLQIVGWDCYGRDNPEELSDEQMSARLLARHYVRCAGFWTDVRDGGHPHDADKEPLTGLVPKILEMLRAQA